MIYIILLSLAIILAGGCVLIYMAWRVLKTHEVKVTPADMEAIKNMESKRMP